MFLAAAGTAVVTDTVKSVLVAAMVAVVATVIYCHNRDIRVGQKLHYYRNRDIDTTECSFIYPNAFAFIIAFTD